MLNLNILRKKAEAFGKRKLGGDPNKNTLLVLLEVIKIQNEALADIYDGSPNPLSIRAENAISRVAKLVVFGRENG